MKRTFLRVVSMCLAVILLTGSVNLSVVAAELGTGNNTATLQSTVQASVSKSGTVTKTDAQLVVDMYSDKLSQLEKDILSQTALVGESYAITKPTDALVTVIPEQKKVTADTYAIASGEVWKPVEVRVYVNGLPEKTLPYVEGGVTFGDVSSNSYYVEVDYELDIAIDSALQQKLLNAPATLAGSLANMGIIKSLSANLNNLASNIDELYAITEAGGGVTIFPNMGPIFLNKGPAETAIVALYAEAKKTENNFTTFDLCRAVSAYALGDDALAFVQANGEKVTSLLTTMDGYLSDMTASNSSLREMLTTTDSLSGLSEEAKKKASLLREALNLLDSICKTIDTVNPACWDVYSATNSPIKSTATPAELTALNTAVVAAVDGTALKAGVAFHNDVTILPTYTAATHTITKGVSQQKVNVNVIANVYEKGATTTIQKLGATKLLVLDKDLAKADVETAIRESGVIDEAVATWDPFYGIDKECTNYEISFVDIPATLTEDITCTVVFTPKACAVDYDYQASEKYGYGYTLTLPAHADAAKSYVYTVGTEQMYQGDSVRILGTTVISRKEGKSLVSETLPAFVAGSTAFDASLTEKDKNILKAGGLLFGTIAISKPETADGLVKVDQIGNLANNEYEVTAQSYATAILVDGAPKTATWEPTKVLVNGTQVATFTGNTAEFTHSTSVNAVSVIYTLTIDEADVNAATVKALAKLPATLANDAATQSSRLNAAVDLVTSDQFADANKLVSVLVSLLTDEKNADKYKPATIAAGHKLGDECLNADSKLLLGDTLAAYSGLTKAGRLAYYYSGDNSVKLNKQIADLADVFAALADDPAFLSWANDMQAGAADLFTEYKDKIADIAVPAVNANIDTKADMPTLTALADALLASGTTSNADVDGKLVYETSVEGVASNLTMITVTVHGGGHSATGSLTYAKDAIVDAGILSEIEALINAKKAEIEGKIDEKYYNVTPVTLPALGDAVTAIHAYEVAYTPKEYKVTLAGEPDMVFTYNPSAMFVNLVGPATVSGVYRYTICGETKDVAYGETLPYTITTAHLDAYFDATNTMAISRTVVDTAREKFVDFVNSLNAAFLAGNVDAHVLMAADPADYSLVLRVGPGMTGIQFNSMMNDLLGALTAYTEIKLAGTTFFNGASVSVQAIIDMLASSGLSFDTVYNIIDDNGNVKNDATLQALTGKTSVGGKIMETEMTLGTLPVDLYISLYGSANALATAKKALGTVKNYANVSCNNGVYNLTLNMPDKAYPYYMSGMLLLDRTSFDGVQANINVGDTMRYYKSLVYGLVSDPNFTVETLENTIADLGRTMDLSTYERVFNIARKAIKYLLDNAEVTNEVSDNEHFSATVTFPAEDAFNMLPASLDKIKEFVVEAQPGGKLSFNVDVTVADRAVDYDAMIFDNSKAGLNKFYYTTDLTAALAGLGNNSIVVLMSDATLSGAVTIPNNAFINLNGFTLNGDLNTAATVTISDSTLHTTGAGVGAVNGTLTGSFKITGGKFSSDVTAMLPKGYDQDADGYVANLYYSFEEDAAGNIDINIPADILATRTVPELRALAVEIALDAAFNVYNAASLTVDGTSLYDFATNDLLDLATKPGSEIINTLMGKVDMDNVKALANSIFAELTDLDTISAKMNDTTGNPDSILLDYALTTTGWQIGLSITADNRIGIDLVPGAQKDRVLTISVDGTPEEKAALAALFTELAKSMDIVATLDQFSVTYSGGLKVTYSGTVTADFDLSHNNDYAALMAAAVASATGNATLKEALKTYLSNGTTVALAAEIEKITVAQFISGLKHLKAVGFDAIMTDLGLTSEKLADLEAIYGDLVYIAGTILTRLDITGGAQTLANYKVNGSFSSYEFGPKTVRNIEIALSLTLMTKVEQPVTPPTPPTPGGPVTPLPSDPSTPTWTPDPVVGNPVIVDNAMESILSYKIDTVDGVQYLYLDANVDGVSKNQLISLLKVNATNALNGAQINITNTVSRNGKEFVKTGSTLTITATNGSKTATKTFVLIIDGDVNCDGMVTSADAVTLAWHYCGTAVIRDKAALLAADVDRSDVAINSADAIRIVLKYMYWKNGDSRYVSKLGS